MAAGSEQAAGAPPRIPPWLPWLTWGLGASLFFYGFFHRIAPSVMIDSLIHVYDLRSLREITPLSFPSGPVLLQFMPKLSSTVLAAAQSGAFQMVDYTHGVLAHKSNTQRIYNTCHVRYSHASRVGVE